MSEETTKENIANSNEIIFFGYPKERIQAASILCVLIPLIIVLLSYLAEANYVQGNIISRRTFTTPQTIANNGVIDYIGIAEIRAKNSALNFGQVNPDSLILPETLLDDLNQLIDSKIISYSDIEWLLILHEVTLSQFLNANSFEESYNFYTTAIEVRERLMNIVMRFES